MTFLWLAVFSIAVCFPLEVISSSEVKTFNVTVGDVRTPIGNRSKAAGLLSGFCSGDYYDLEFVNTLSFSSTTNAKYSKRPIQGNGKTLQCNGPSSRLCLDNEARRTATCRNTGVRVGQVRWSCTVDLSYSLLYAYDLRVSCEGKDTTQDSCVLQGSCVLFYRLTDLYVNPVPFIVGGIFGFLGVAVCCGLCCFCCCCKRRSSSSMGAIIRPAQTCISVPAPAHQNYPSPVSPPATTTPYYPPPAYQPGPTHQPVAVAPQYLQQAGYPQPATVAPQYLQQAGYPQPATVAPQYLQQQEYKSPSTEQPSFNPTFKSEGPPPPDSDPMPHAKS